MYNLIIRPLLFCIDPEKVHRMLLSWLKFYRYLFPVRACVRGYSRVSDPFSYGHLQFKNRIGLSAGFDKNAEAFDELADFGFGFLEVGTVTPDSQSGNPSPRIFRLVDDESLISRTGFNNCGVDAVRQHIRKYRKHSYVLGVNINKNPLSTGDQIVKYFESTFIHLYDCVDYFTLNWGSINHIEKNPAWLQAAKSTLDFIEKYCFDSDGRMYFEMTADGRPLRKRRYIFSESFAAIAMSEYSIASGDKTYAVKALELFKRMQYFLQTPGLLAPKYTDTLPMKGHSITMILINVASRIREAIQDECLTRQIDESISCLEKDFLHPEFKALLETVGPNGEFIDSNMGRTINPGHCIETAWFLLEESKLRGRDQNIKELGLKILDWSWEWGWDKEFGGIINFKDCRNLPSQDYAQDMKFWWPQTEAIIATLYAYLMTKEEKYLKMHQQISEWTYTHFPDKEYGEWYGYLHRDGTVAQPAKGNLFKGPFHVPRMMTKGYMLCEEIMSEIKKEIR